MIASKIEVFESTGHRLHSGNLRNLWPQCKVSGFDAKGFGSLDPLLPPSQVSAVAILLQPKCSICCHFLTYDIWKIHFAVGIAK